MVYAPMSSARLTLMLGLLACSLVASCGESDEGRSGTIICQGNCDCSPPDTICIEGRCAEGCTHTDCPLGAFCDTGSGLCVSETAAPCQRDLDCAPPDLICASSSTKTCEPGCTLTCCFGGTLCNTETGYCETDPLHGCRDDRDCDIPEETCVGGRCLTPRYCLADSDCDLPKICEGGLCLDGCGVWGCDAPLHCVGTSGHCEPPEGPCGGDADCGFPAAICEGGACVAPCAPADCAAPLICVQATGRCGVDTTPTGCDDDGDCAPPATICSVLGECVTGCQSNGCGAGSHCNIQSGHCVPDEPPQTCTNDTNCAPPLTICEAPDCVNGCLTEPCSGNTTCNQTTGRCEAVDPGCLADAQCDPPATVCNNGSCVAGCPASPCPVNADCDPTTGHCLHPLDLGELCESSQDCLSGMCITIALTTGAQYNVCVMPCCGGSDCPAGFGCMAQSGVKFCTPASLIPGATFAVADGGPCTNATQCQSGVCEVSKGRCVEICCTTGDCMLAGLDTCQLYAATTASKPQRICDLDQAQYSPYCYDYPNCTSPAGAPCQSDFECQSLMCDNVYQGSSGFACTEFCCKNEQCPAGFSCRMYSEQPPGFSNAIHAMMCLKDGATPLGEGCTYGKDCSAGDCIEGTCRRLCCSDQDCPNGQDCALAIKDDATSGLQTFVTCCE